jgi:2-desacetyl-2-hydroxyethyl bacteriochlorophyllide A dehydrogenase
MKAIRASIIAEQTVKFVEFELSDQPSGAEVLVKVERTIISAGTELANYTGLDPDTRIPGRWCCYPWNPGYGGIGRVVAVGPDVKHLCVGQRVYGIFNHGTYTLVDTNSRLCVPVPDDLDSTTAIFTRMANVAISAYQKSHVSLGDTVVMIGLGLVGNLAGQFYALAGQRIIGLDPAAHRRDLAEKCGFHAVIDPKGLSTEQLLERILAVNYAQKPRCVVDAVGESSLVEQGVALAANNGEVIMLGTPRAVYETDATKILKPAHVRGISIVGALEWLIPLLKRQGPGISTEANAEVILRMIADGRLHVKPLCSHVLPPAQLNDAYQGLLHRKDEYVGVVLDWENYPPPAPD